jgi:hypothetical protein
MFRDEADERIVIATAGETGTPPDDSVALGIGPTEIVVEFAFRVGATAEMREEAKILATSLVDSFTDSGGGDTGSPAVPGPRKRQ